MKRVLVTGATGFIGRWSVPLLLAAGYDVHAVVSGNPRRELPAQLAGARVHAVDLLDDAARDALCDSLDATHLLHFAWIATPGVYMTSPDNARWLAASEGLLARFRCNGGIRAVMAGSCAEYDWSRVSVCRESASTLIDVRSAQATAYARSKVAMHLALERFSRERALSSAWGRIFFQYGPQEHPARLVPSVIIQLLRNAAARCTHGRQVRSFLHVADVAGAFVALLESGVEGPVNIGSAEAVSVGQLIRRIAEEIGRPELVHLGARPAPPHEPAMLIPDVGRLRLEVRWQPQFTLPAGLRDTIDWWRTTLADSSMTAS